jgi:hypothetical protein
MIPILMIIIDIHLVSTGPKLGHTSAKQLVWKCMDESISFNWLTYSLTVKHLRLGEKITKLSWEQFPSPKSVWWVCHHNSAPLMMNLSPPFSNTSHQREHITSSLHSQFRSKTWSASIKQTKIYNDAFTMTKLVLMAPDVCMSKIDLPSSMQRNIISLEPDNPTHMTCVP